VTPLWWGDTRVKAIKSDSDNDSDEQKRSPGFSGKNRGVTPSVAAPGVTHPSDATGYVLCLVSVRVFTSVLYSVCRRLSVMVTK